MAGKGKGSTDAAAELDKDDELNVAADGATEAADGAAQRLQDAADAARGFDAEASHNTALDRMANLVDDLMLNADELVFDVRDFLLDIIKTRPKPWSGTSQAEQRDIAAACETNAKELVRKVAELVASNGVPSIRILLTKFAIGTDMVITGKVKAYDEDEKHRAVSVLSDSINKHVMLTRASAEDYIQGERQADTDPDEPGFGFEAGDDEPPADADQDADQE